MGGCEHILTIFELGKFTKKLNLCAESLYLSYLLYNIIVPFLITNSYNGELKVLKNTNIHFQDWQQNFSSELHFCWCLVQILNLICIPAQTWRERLYKTSLQTFIESNLKYNLIFKHVGNFIRDVSIQCGWKENVFVLYCANKAKVENWRPKNRKIPSASQKVLDHSYWCPTPLFVTKW